MVNYLYICKYIGENKKVRWVTSDDNCISLLRRETQYIADPLHHIPKMRRRNKILIWIGIILLLLIVTYYLVLPRILGGILSS